MLSEYEAKIVSTDRIDPSALTPILLGLYGEVGSVMSTSKKWHREKAAFAGYRRDVEEELGDALWYIAAMCRRLGVKLTEVFAEVLRGDGLSSSVAANSDAGSPLAQVFSIKETAARDHIMLSLGEKAAKLLGSTTGDDVTKQLLIDFLRSYIEAVQVSGIPFSDIVNGNLTKALGRFGNPFERVLPDFDEEFAQEEQLPRQFQIEVTQRANGRSYLRWNGVFIGDPLLDNIADRDGYRFHDVFHFANAAILHWSPTFRALIKHKRKSKPEVEEAQDSGRAIVIDEGVSAYIFSCAKELKFFEDQDTVSFDLLKTVQNFVRGYEVEACPLGLWEVAILQGYKVFRQMKQNGGGFVIGDRDKRTLIYQEK